MASPTNPTRDELVAEGLRKAGIFSPSSTVTAVARDKWLEEIKNDIWRRIKHLKFLQITAYGIIPQGQSRFSNPTDFASDLSLTLLDGNGVGTATGGGSGYVDLAASESYSESDLQGKHILITSGTGQASYSQITSYNSSTKRASVTPNFQTAPASGSGYKIIDVEYEVERKPIIEMDYLRVMGRTRPLYFFPVGDEDYGEFILNSPPDKEYGARLRYYANIMKIDVLSTHMSTLYLNYRSVWLKGIEWRALKENKHADQMVARQEYEAALAGLVFGDAYGVDMNNLRMRVGDYA